MPEEEEPESPMDRPDDISKILESCVPRPDDSGGMFAMIESDALRDLAREDSGHPQMNEGEYVTTANGGRRKKPTACANCGVKQGDDVEIRACSKCKPESFVIITIKTKSDFLCGQANPMGTAARSAS